MSTSSLSRRGFLTGLLTSGGILSLGVGTVACGPSQQQLMIRHADKTGELAPNMYVAVKRDGRVAVAINKTEIGQGVSTAFSTLVAEELDVSLDAIDFHFADSFPEYRTSFNMHQTGGSTSTKEAYLPLRKAAACAREMLVTAAASQWGVAVSECTTDGAKVFHKASNRELTYGALTTKAAHLPVPEEPRLKAKSQYKLIGKTTRRVDARAKVDGTAKFGLDINVPHMVRAVAIHAPAYGAEPRRVKADAAKGRPGVLGVYTFSWGVAVVAEKHWQALAAARDVEIEWGPGIAAGLDTDKLRNAVRAYTKDGETARDDGNVDKALSHPGAKKLEAVYEAPFLAHAPMEPQNCTVDVRDGKVEVWAPCQGPTIVQEYVAEAIGVGRDDVLVHTTYAGGGFGRRIYGDWAAQAAQISKEVRRPVQLMWTRESDMTQGYYRPQLAGFMKGAVDGQGRVTAIGAHLIGQSIALDFEPGLRAALPGMPRGISNIVVKSLTAMFATNTIADVFATEGMKQTPYQVDNVRIAFTPISTKLPVASWRSVGHSFNGFVMESFIDELAHAAKQDPVELRRKMLPAGSRPRRVLDAVAALSKWGVEPLKPGMGRGVARHESFESEVAEVAEVEVVDGRIKVRRVFCAVECGVAVNPDVVRSQMEGAIIFGLSAALDQELTIVDGAVQQTNYDTFPPLRMHECPEIIVQIVESDAQPTGVGEPGLPPIAAAVANAVFAATGIRLRRLPLQKALNEVKR